MHVKQNVKLMCLLFRSCVDEDDKALSIAFTEILLCALAYSPAPVVYGALLGNNTTIFVVDITTVYPCFLRICPFYPRLLITDAACMVWGQSCGKTGNCWLYDGQALRYQINFAAAGLYSMSCIQFKIHYTVSVIKEKFYAVCDQPLGGNYKSSIYNVFPYILFFSFISL